MAALARKRIFREQLNAHFGYYYTIDKTLYSGKTKFQKIEMVHTPEFGNTLLLDGITQVVEKNEFQYHEPMVHPALCAHSKPEHALVIGGGDGGILREALKYRTIKHVDFAELDEDVVAFSRKYLSKMNQGSFDDPRVSVRITDGRKWVEQNPGKYDVVIMDMTDPFGPSRFLYTRQFFRAVKKSFRSPKSLFVMHTESPISRPVAFNCILKTLRSEFACVQPLYTYIQMYATLWSIGICSDASAISTMSPSAIDKRLARQGISGLHVINGSSLAAMRVAYPYIDDILKKKGRIITDARPDFPDNFL
jgi:spermidine synthase